MDLSGGGGEEAESTGGEVEEEVFADELVSGGEVDGVELGEEAVEAGGAAGEGRERVVGDGGVGEPGGAVDDELLVVAAEADEEESVFGEFAEAVIGALDIVESVAWDEVLVEFSSSIHLKMRLTEKLDYSRVSEIERERFD